MATRDLPQARHLLAELGYDIEPVEVQRRFEVVMQTPAQAVFLAEENGRVTGLPHLYVRPALEKPPEVVVQARMIEEGARGTGVGRSLMNTAEEPAKERGFTSLALTSHIARSGSHTFYERLGYRIEATSHLMRKALR
jgi:GNAT superfamily N-acetyltransferase